MLDSNKSGGFFFRLIWKEYAKVKWDHFPKQCSGWKMFKELSCHHLESRISWVEKETPDSSTHFPQCFFLDSWDSPDSTNSTLGRSSEGHLWTVCLVTSWWLLRWSWRIFNGKPSQQKNTAWMSKIATENIPSQKETSMPPIFFQGLCSTSGVY